MRRIFEWSEWQQKRTAELLEQYPCLERHYLKGDCVNCAYIHERLLAEKLIRFSDLLT